ncbi:hypothetical protein ACQCVH_22105 [Bacillus infantis]|uniref:hypothetical protein n=1 Tax=Bacillus infantis TaxID=324767 RepID=UPI003CF60786
MVFSLESVNISNLKQIGSPGYEYNVYALSDELVLKKSTGRHIQNSGKILKQLQGLPFIPKVHEFGEDWLIMDRIQGVQLGFYCAGYSWFNVRYDVEKHGEKVEEFFDGCLKRGWTPRDLHFGNVMIDQQGDLWIVDVGGFIKDSTENPLDIEYKRMLRYGTSISHKYGMVEYMINLLGKDKVYEICHPNYW